MCSYTVRNKRRQDVNVSLVQSIKEHVLVDHAAGLDEAKERALLVSGGDGGRGGGARGCAIVCWRWKRKAVVFQ